MYLRDSRPGDLHHLALVIVEDMTHEVLKKLIAVLVFQPPSSIKNPGNLIHLSVDSLVEESAIARD